MHVLQVTIGYTRTAHHIVNSPLKAVTVTVAKKICAAEVEGQVTRPYFHRAASGSENRDWLHEAIPPPPHT